MASPGYPDRKKFNAKIQKVAIATGLYSELWPEYKSIPIDSLPTDFANAVDIGGGDLALFGRGGSMIFVAHRFRRYKYIKRGCLDFTVREAEYDRHIRAIKTDGFVPGFYIYGYASEDEKTLVEAIAIKYKAMMNDIASHTFSLLHMDVARQENFYYVAFNQIFPRYIVKRWTFFPPAAVLEQTSVVNQKISNIKKSNPSPNAAMLTWRVLISHAATYCKHLEETSPQVLAMSESFHNTRNLKEWARERITEVLAQASELQPIFSHDASLWAIALNARKSSIEQLNQAGFQLSPIKAREGF